MRNTLLTVLALMLWGCGTFYKEPSSSTPRALISGKQNACVIGCGKGVFIQAVNGVAMSTMWKANNYYVSLGPTNIVIAVADIGLYGVCALDLDVVDGEEYEISHKIEGGTFAVTAYDRSGTPQSSCTARMGPAPVGSTYIPVIIPVGS